MNEHGFVKSVHRTLNQLGSIYYWKIAAKFQNGVPDAYYSGPGGDLWCEYKYVPSGRKIKISALQRLWLEGRSSEGRTCWLAVLTNRGVRLYTAPPYPERLEDDYLDNLMTLKEFKNCLVKQLE